LTKWKLLVERGRQVWVYDPQQKPEEQKFWEKYFLGLDINKEAPPLPKPKDAIEACRNAMSFWAKLQTDDGHWADDYGGPMFLLPGLVITAYITGTELTKWQKIEMIRYLTNHQNPDGGWGLHIESESTVFGTATTYVTMRILGVSADDNRLVRARAWLHRHGTANIPQWGKMWLATLGVLDWSAVNPILPELWLLPYWVPFHPGRMWCHCRVVYLPMAYIYGTRSTAKETELIRQLRQELYAEPYETINWAKYRFSTLPCDRYRAPSFILKCIFSLFQIYEKCPIQWLRQKAIAETLDHIRYEDIQTHYIDIGPVNKALDMLSEYYASGGKSEAFKEHQKRLADYLWLAADGMKMQGYNGSQLWDTAFAMQALIHTGLAREFPEMIVKGHNYIEMTQVLENAPDMKKYYRHISKGAWPFSTRDHGWPISDCTAEGLQTALLCRFEFPDLIKNPLSDERLFDAVNVMLSLQNKDGGWPSYENMRSGAWMEWLNPSECFDGIMVDYSYTECSGACIKALTLFNKYFPNHRADEIKRAIQRGIQFLKRTQRPDGSWHGCWGVCYTYAIWFAVGALCVVGESKSETVTKALDFLLRHQRSDDGGWGEDFRSCAERRWVEYKESHVVNTAWATLSLMLAERPEHADAVKRGIQCLMKRQLPNGDWEQQGISGVFNYNCAISYSGYKNIFPIWALGHYINKYPYADPKDKLKRK
jgi:lanosterol synthase